jgi:hypothetical protein
MNKEYFVDEKSIVRQIWGKSDTILFIFAGASAEFALNKAVDWLYFTGKLPADPLGRLFSTVSYARLIVFAEKEAANRAIDAMAAIHSAIETKRGMSIPDWAYRDVLFMLIDYSIRSFEVLERPLSKPEKQEVFDVFNRVGKRMGLKGLPENYDAWLKMRGEHLAENLEHSIYTEDLFRQYKKHLGFVRYKILLEVQTLVAPLAVRQGMKRFKTSFVNNLLGLYKVSRLINADGFLKSLILPSKYKKEIKGLNIAVR